jgi:hypothetical protein
MMCTACTASVELYCFCDLVAELPPLVLLAANDLTQQPYHCSRQKMSMYGDRSFFILLILD